MVKPQVSIDGIRIAFHVFGLEKNYMHFLSIGLVRTDFGQQFAEVRRVHGQRVTVAFPAC